MLSSRIASLEKKLKSEAKRSESASRLMSLPRTGPITAMAIEPFAPTITTVRKKDETLQPGLGWCLNSIRAMESRFCAVYRAIDTAVVL